MPPSGYSSKQSRFIIGLLRSCAEALVEEASEKLWTLPEALDNEINNIHHYLDMATTTKTQLAVLHLTEVFYRDVRNHHPGDIDAFWNAVEVVSKKLELEMLAIKVPMAA